MPNGGRINFQVNMDVKKNGLKDLIEPLKQVQSKMNSISSNGNLDEPFKEAASAAKQLESIINSSWNDKLNQLNLNQFNQSIKTSFKDVESLKNILTQAGPEGQAAFNQVASAVLNTNVQLRESNKLLDSMATSMANTVKWGITSSIFNNITSSIQHAYYYAKDLDSSLNDIRIVTGDSADQMQRFARTANNAAKDLGRSTLDYTKAALSFYQQGLSDDEVKARTEVSLKAQNITGAGSQMYDQLTAVWNGFKVATEDTESVVDKLAAVADNSASNMSQLATAMSKVAATANVMGVDVDQLTAQISTVVAATRLAPESVGTAFKTIYSRLNDIKTGADEAQVSLGNYSGKMAELGFNVLDSAGNLRDTGQVIEQIGGRWQTLTRQQQVYLAQTMGGQRQITQVMALFDNWDKYLNNLNVSMSSQGTLMEKNNTYLESTEAHLQQLGAESERTYDILFNQDTVNGFVDALDGVLKIFNDFIDGLGGGTTVFVNFGATIANIFSKQIGSAINTQLQNIETLKNNISQIKSQQQWSQVALESVKAEHTLKGDVVSSSALEQQATIAQRTLQVRKALTQEQYISLQQMQQQVGVAQTKIDYLEQYKTILQDIGISENASTQVVQDNLEAKKEQLDLQKIIADYIQLSLIPSSQLTEKQKERITIAEDILLSENEEAGVLVGISEKQQGIIEKLQTQVLSDDQIRELLKQQNILIEDQQQYVNKLKQAVDGRKAAEDGTTEKLKEENELRKRIISQQQDSAARQLNIQKAVRATTGIIQSLSGVIGGISTAINESATASEKLNGVWSAGTSAIAGIANIFMPGSGFLIQGLGAAIKSSLELFGVWGKVENIFKSTQEKAQQLSNNLKENLDKAMQPLNKKKTLEGLKEEFDELIGDADSYSEVIQNLTDDEQDRYHEILNQIAEINPQIVDAYDAQHNAIIENNKALDLTIEKLQKEYQLQQSLAYSQGQINSELSLLSDIRDDKAKVQKKYDKKESNFDTMTQNFGARTAADFSSEGGKIEVADILSSMGAYGFMADANGRTMYKAPSASNQPYGYGIFESLYDLEGLNDLTKAQMDNELSQFIGWVNEKVDENGKVLNGLFIEKYNELEANLAEIAKVDYLGDAKGKLDAISGEESKLVNQLINDISQALVVSDDYNRVYTSFKDSLGENFESSGFADLMQAIIKDEVTGFLNSDHPDINEQDYDEKILLRVNEVLESLFNNISPDKIVKINEELEKLYLQSIDEEKPLSVKEYEEKLKNLIQSFVLDNEDLLNALSEDVDSDNYKNAIHLLESIFGVSGLQLGENAVVESYNESIQNTLNRLKENGQIVSSSQAIQNDQTMKRSGGRARNIPGALTGSGLTSEEEWDQAIKKLTEGTEYSEQQVQEFLNFLEKSGEEVEANQLGTKIAEYFDNKAIEEEGQKVIDNFDKITSAIDRLQSGKDLKYKDKKWLAENVLGQQALKELKTNEQWLDALVDEVINTTDEVKKQAGFETIFKDFETLEKYKDQLSQGDQKTAFTIALQNEKEALQVNTQALQNYVQLYGLVADASTQQGQQEIINKIKQQNVLKSLTEQAKALVETTGEMDSDSLLSFTTGLQELFGENLDPTYIKNNIQAIADLLSNGYEYTNLEQFKEDVANWEPTIENEIIANKDKINSVLQSLANGDGLNLKDRDWIKKLFHLTESDIAQLQTQGKLAQQIFLKAMQTGDKETQQNAIQSYMTGLDDFYAAKKSGAFKRQVGESSELALENERLAYQTALQNDMTSYGVDSTFLQNYAKDLGLVGKSLQQLFRIYQKGADNKSLQQMAENLAKNKDELTVSSKAFQDFKTELNKVFGTDYSSTFIIQNIDAIVEALNRGITDAQAFGNALSNFKPPVEPIEKGPSEYEQQRDLTEDAGAARKSLQSGSALSDDQAAALAQLEAAHAELAALGAEESRNSAEYLSLLQQIIELENRNLQIKRESALNESQNTLANLQKQKEIYADLLAKQPENVYLRQQVEQIEGKISEEKAKQIQLQQQLKQEQIETPEKEIDEDINRDNWEDLSQYLSDYADKLEDVSNQVKGNVEASEDLAQSILRFDAALESVQKNYEDWEQMLTSGSIQDAAQAGAELQNVYSDLLDLPFESLSPDFTQNIDNLHLLQQAANGSEQAYNQLMQAAQQDIQARISLDNTQFWNAKSQVEAAMDQMQFEDIQIGASLDTGNFLQQLSNMVTAAGMTADQATDYLSSMGIDAEVKQVPAKTEQIPTTEDFWVPGTYSTTAIETGGQLEGRGVFNALTQTEEGHWESRPSGHVEETSPSAFTLEVTSAKKKSGGNFKFNNASHGGGSKSPKSSGGGGGGGGGKPKKGGGGGSGKTTKPKVQKAIKDKSDRYHDINIDLKHINDELEKLQQNEKKLTGKDLIKNLEAQLKVLEKQKEAYKTKLELEKQERDELQKTLEKSGAKFDKNGDISNYSTLLSTALSDLNKEIAKYNAMTAQQQQKYQSTLDAAKERYETLKDNIKRYDDIVSEEIPELQKNIRNIEDQIVEKQIQKFKIKVDLQLDLSKAERDFNEFRKKVIDKIKDDDILGNTKALLKDFSSYYKKGGKGVITGLTNQVNDTLEQLYSIDKTGTSSVYGDNRAAALKDLQEYTNKLMENLEDVEDLVDDIKESIFDAIDKAQDAFDKQVNEYQFISKLIDHDVKMVELLYGDDAYESMSKYHSQQQENNNKQLDFLKRQKDYWAGQMAAEQARMNNLDPGTAAFKEAQKRFEEYKKHWMSSVEDLNSKLEDSLENIIDKYANAIDLTFDKLNKKLTDGKGLEYVNEEWQLINKKSDMYLDKINSMYEIDKLENAYQDLLKDNEGNLAAQRSIKDMMKEQIAYLKDKDKLTQYDVDRANALLQIEVKRLALEQQRQSKTKLRLRRDSQGNYTYQYTADQESLDNAEQELRDAENSLYNMTRQAYKNNLKDFYDTYSDWQDRIKEVAKDTTLTVEEQQQKMAMLNQYYGDMINGYVEENANLQKFLMQDAFDELSTMYGTDVKNYESMIQEEKQALMGDLVPQWDSSVQDMINIFAGEKNGKKGFLPTVQDAFTGIDTATKQYEASLDTLQQVAGVSFQDIANGMDATSVEAQKLLDDNITLINAYGAEVNAVQGVINKIEQMQSAYGLAEAAAIAAAQAASKYIQKEGDLNKVAAAAQAAKSAVEAAAAARAAANNSNPSSPSSGGGGGNTGSGSGGSGGGSGTGSGNGGGNTSSNSNKPKITSTYGPNGPSTVYWRRDSSGNIKYGSGYATGGYTGSWGDEGKIAILHEKELVLNKEDTANMLQAVSIVRTMNDMLAGMNSNVNIANAIGLMGSGTSNGTIEQNVHIEASFPNVTDHSEIEQALNNLVNRASQFAFKN